MATTTMTATSVKAEPQFIPFKVESLPPVKTFAADADPADIVAALKLRAGIESRVPLTKTSSHKSRQISAPTFSPTSFGKAIFSQSKPAAWKA